MREHDNGEVTLTAKEAVALRAVLALDARTQEAEEAGDDKALERLAGDVLDSVAALATTVSSNDDDATKVSRPESVSKLSDPAECGVSADEARALKNGERRRVALYRIAGSAPRLKYEGNTRLWRDGDLITPRDEDWAEYSIRHDLQPDGTFLNEDCLMVVLSDAE